MEKELIPIIPAAHYHMGGTKVNLDGMTSISGLWACGQKQAQLERMVLIGLQVILYLKLCLCNAHSKKINSSKIKINAAKSINIKNYLPKEKTISKIRAKKNIFGN